MRGLTIGFVLLAQLAVAAAQDLHWLPIADAGGTAVGVLWARGYDDDPPGVCGAARLLAELRLGRARRCVPGLLASGLQVGGDFALVFGVVAPGDAAAAAGFVGALLDDRLPLDDDTLALATARAALAADDAEHIFPGPVLETRARRRLARGTPAARPPAGDAAALAGLAPDRVRALLREQVPVLGGGLGNVAPTVVAAVAALPWAAGPQARRRAWLAVAGRGAPDLAVEEHSRVDAPFVAVAFPAPAPALADGVVFATAVEVAAARARARLRARGTEALARSPLVAWSWLFGEPLVMFYRRGEDPLPLLPGERPAADALAEAAATRAELEGLLADLRGRPPSAEEVAQAVAEVAVRWGLPDSDAPQAGEPATLPGRLQNLLLAALRGIDLRQFDLPAPEAVGAVLAATLDPERASWHALVPVPRADRGFRRR